MQRNIINESEWNYHFGDNHNGEPYYSDNKKQMYGRDTGHFGSGTYFSTYKLNPHERGGHDDMYQSENTNADPHFIQIKDGLYRVDFDLYKNLYRVTSTHHGDVLYSMLKNVNAFYNRISSIHGFNQHEADYDNALLYQKIQRNAKALNLKCPSYYELTRMAQNHTGIQSFSTLFMEYNGYNGVNVSGIEYYDNTTHGSVIYDLSKVNTDMEQVAPNSLYTSDKSSHTSKTVFGLNDDEMNAGTGQNSVFWANKLNDMPLPKAMRVLKNNIEHGDILDGYHLKNMNPTLQSRYLKLLYTHYSSGYSDSWGNDCGYKIFYYDSSDKNAYIETIIKNNAFYWVNYKPKQYDKPYTGFTFIANHLFWDIPYDADERQEKVKIIDNLKSFLTRDLTKYETQFIEYNTNETEFDEAINRSEELKKVKSLMERVENVKMEERLTLLI